MSRITDENHSGSNEIVLTSDVGKNLLKALQDQARIAKEINSPISRHGMLLDDISEELNISPQAVHQILQSALRKMRGYLLQNGFSKEDFLC